jgi:DNA polymerase III subunit epsilon
MKWYEPIQAKLKQGFRVPQLFEPPVISDTPERWIVLDVETSGLDPEVAQLLAIACVGLRVNWARRTLTIVPGDSFEVVIKPEQSVQDKDNILVHGIGLQRQEAGLPGWQAMKMFTDFIGDAPLLAFHAWFDKRMMDRHGDLYVGQRLNNPWVDIEKLCAVTHPDLPYESLDDWMDHYDISCPARHEAAADTYAECEVLQRIWPLVALDAFSFKDLVRMEKQERWARG